MAIETYLHIPHHPSKCPHPASSDWQADDVDPSSPARLEWVWPYGEVIGPEFLEAVQPANALLLEKIIALQTARRCVTHRVDLAAFLALLTNVCALARHPPWQVGRRLKLAREAAHPDAERLEELLQWVQRHAGCSTVFGIEYYNNTSGFGDAGPQEVEV